MKPQIENSLGDLKDKVVNASDLGYPFYTSKEYLNTLSDALKEKGAFNDSWQKEVENYCNENNLTVQDLIAFHREHSKSKLKPTERLKTDKETPSESKHLNWRDNLTKKKTGQ